MLYAFKQTKSVICLQTKTKQTNQKCYMPSNQNKKIWKLCMYARTCLYNLKIVLSLHIYQNRHDSLLDCYLFKILMLFYRYQRDKSQYFANFGVSRLVPKSKSVLLPSNFKLQLALCSISCHLDPFSYFTIADKGLLEWIYKQPTFIRNSHI